MTNLGNPDNVGILGLEVYFPKDYVAQADLEAFDGVSKGKYTTGLGQRNMAVCDNAEDIVSMCLTVLEQLMNKYQLSYEDIGRLEVGTETLIDKSKSVKTFLMEQFNQHKVFDVLGVDTINACYGGTNALFNAVNWVESSSYNEKLAIVICGDIALYERGAARPTGGAGAVAMLVGKNAPICLETKHIASHFEHIYDFYKPQMNSEYPVVNGLLSNIAYMRSLAACYTNYKRLYQQQHGMPFELQKNTHYVIFHSPYTKLVQKAFTQLHRLDEIAKGTPENRKQEKLALEKLTKTFDQAVAPGLLLARECGNMYTGSVYASLASVIGHESSSMERSEATTHQASIKRTLVFSYGSGSSASMFSLLMDTTHQSFREVAQKFTWETQLSQRNKLSPEAYHQRLDEREEQYQAGTPKRLITTLEPPHLFEHAYYCKSIDPLGQRVYAKTPGNMP